MDKSQIVLVLSLSKIHILMKAIVLLCIYLCCCIFQILNCYKVFDMSLLPFLLGGRVHRNDSCVSILTYFPRGMVQTFVCFGKIYNSCKKWQLLKSWFVEILLTQWLHDYYWEHRKNNCITWTYWSLLSIAGQWWGRHLLLLQIQEGV